MAKKAETTENIVETKNLVANKNFNDKYTATVYAKGTEFVVDETVEETTKVSDKKYKITARRAEELKAKKVVD